MLDMPRATSRLLSLLAGAAVLFLAGCQPDEITHYRIPREPRTKATLSRFLGAIIPHGEKSWFVKVVGPQKVVKEHVEEFRQFVGSIRFPEKDKDAKPITFTAPAGWREQPDAGKNRFATFRIGGDEHPLELTVTAFGGSVLQNVNRWRDNMGLTEISQDELPTETEEMKLEGGAVATLVDLTGVSRGGMGMGPAAGGLPAGHPPLAAEENISYKAPPDWKEVASKRPSRATFVVADGGQEARVTVTPLPALDRRVKGGETLLTYIVNIERAEVGLPVADEKEINRSKHSFRVAGADGSYFDVAGPEAKGAERKRVLAVALPHGGKTWFFRMVGPDALVVRQQTAFEGFVASVRFAEGGGN
jgi:hypothetical protein